MFKIGLRFSLEVQAVCVSALQTGRGSDSSHSQHLEANASFCT